jgi:O-antigen/teichoic acid export membrane protein
MYLIEFVLLLNAQMLLQFTSIILRANGNTSILSRSMLLERSLSLVVLIAFLNHDQNPPFSLVIACTTLIVSIIQIYSSVTAIKFKDLVNYIVWNPWHNSLGIGSTQILSQIQQLDLNLLALLSNTTSAATYGAVSRWTNAMGVFAGGFSQSIMPSASRESFDKSEIRELRKASVWLVMAILSSVFIYIFASRIVAIVLGTKYSDSAGILRVLAVAAVASTFTQPIATYLQAKGLNLQVFRALIIGIVVQILMIVVTNSSLGAYSAAYGYLIGQFVAAILLLNSFASYKRKRSMNLL